MIALPQLGKLQIGLLGVLLVYLCLLLVTLVNGPSILKEHEAKMASIPVTIEATKPKISESQPKISESHTSAPQHQPQADAHEQQTQHKATSPEPVAEPEVLAGGALVPAPVDGLYEDTPQGRLPRIGPNGLTPFSAYRRPFKQVEAKAFVALGVVNFGLSERESKQAVEQLPPEVSLILSPYSLNPEQWQAFARKKGHELWLDFPIENGMIGGSDTGALTIMTRNGLEANQVILRKILGRSAGYAGIAAFTDNVFGDALPMMQTILPDVFTRGLGVLDLNPQGSQNFSALARERNVPFVRAQGLAKVGENYDDFFEIIEAQALGNGKAVVIVPLYPKSLQMISAWTRGLADRGIVLAPISAMASQQKQ